MNFLAEIRRRFLTALESLSHDAWQLDTTTFDPLVYTAMIRPAQDAKFGDYQANFAMPLAKQLKLGPKDVAATIVERVMTQTDLGSLCEQPEIAGPGFINLRIRPERLVLATRGLVGDDRCGVTPVTELRPVVVDFSSPNVAKPMHVGHLRSTVLGDAIQRILRFLGHQVITDNHVGDWGTQFGMIIYGYKHFRDQAALDRAIVPELARLYRLVNQLCDYWDAVQLLPSLLEQRLDELANVSAIESEAPKDKEENDLRKRRITRCRNLLVSLDSSIVGNERKIAAVSGEATLAKYAADHPDIVRLSREETAKLHAGDAENRALWERFLPPCLAMIHTVYDRLGVRFDHELGESFFQPWLGEVVDELIAAGLSRESEGAQCVFLDGVDAPFIVRKRDGAYTYATTDLATIRYRVREWDARSILYVVDARQSDHFKMLFETAKRWGFGDCKLSHVSFGTILGQDKKPYKTRSGDTVGLESLLNEGVERARATIDANQTDGLIDASLDDAAKQQIAETIGLGAIKYADLSQNRDSDYVFDWDKMLAFRGDTAAYMQYAYARVCGIMRRGEIDRDTLRTSGDLVTLDAPAERALAIQLHRFSEALDAAASESRPNLLTQYLYETANCFSTFFENCPVLKAETELLRQSRLRLCDLTARTIAKGLELLGIGTVERM
jgi:arginyl-tRNA synthetase